MIRYYQTQTLRPNVEVYLDTVVPPCFIEEENDELKELEEELREFASVVFSRDVKDLDESDLDKLDQIGLLKMDAENRHPLRFMTGGDARRSQSDWGRPLDTDDDADDGGMYSRQLDGDGNPYSDDEDDYDDLYAPEDAPAGEPAVENNHVENLRGEAESDDDEGFEEDDLQFDVDTMTDEDVERAAQQARRVAAEERGLITRLTGAARVAHLEALRQAFVREQRRRELAELYDAGPIVEATLQRDFDEEDADAAREAATAAAAAAAAAAEAAEVAEAAANAISLHDAAMNTEAINTEARADSPAPRAGTQTPERLEYSEDDLVEVTHHTYIEDGYIEVSRINGTFVDTPPAPIADPPTPPPAPN